MIANNFEQLMSKLDDIKEKLNSEEYETFGKLIAKSCDDLLKDDLYEIKYIEYESKELYTGLPNDDRSFMIRPNYKRQVFRRRDIRTNDLHLDENNWTIGDLIDHIGRPILIKTDPQPYDSVEHLYFKMTDNNTGRTFKRWDDGDQEFDDNGCDVYIHSPPPILLSVTKLE